MSLPDFLTELFEGGRVAVSEPQELTPDNLNAAGQLLEERQRIDRLNLPEDVPQFHRTSALKAAANFYQAAQLAIFRDLGADAISGLAKGDVDDWQLPEVHYSVDLTLRYLPELLRIAATAAPDDPLVAVLLNWARRWPLSSVGIDGVGDVDIGPIVRSPGLMLQYVDRIVARGDLKRAEYEPISQAVRKALGLYPQLAPKFAERLHMRGHTDER